jgi:uncharacterized protein YqhQ
VRCGGRASAAPATKRPTQVARGRDAAYTAVTVSQARRLALMSQHPPRSTQDQPSLLTAATRSGAPQRVGGMAMGNGVVMRSRHFWAMATSDGALDHGAVSSLLERDRRLRLPLVRSLVALVEMTGFAIARHRSNSRRRNYRLLAWLGVYVLLATALQYVLPAAHQSAVLDNFVLQVAGIALGLLVIWVGMGPDVWRFHGAEHTAVNAYEHGADLDDLDEVATFSRIHDRCGTNLVVLIIVLMLAYTPFYGDGLIAEVAALVWSVVAIAIAFELFKLVGRRPGSPLSRAVLFGGRLMQRTMTTRPPTPEQLRVACEALKVVVVLEGALITGAEAAPIGSRWTQRVEPAGAVAAVVPAPEAQ